VAFAMISSLASGRARRRGRVDVLQDRRRRANDRYLPRNKLGEKFAFEHLRRRRST